jgi:hypothetical protein
MSYLKVFTIAEQIALQGICFLGGVPEDVVGEIGQGEEGGCSI